MLYFPNSYGVCLNCNHQMINWKLTPMKVNSLGRGGSAPLSHPDLTGSIICVGY